jgi:hypothetical protein
MGKNEKNWQKKKKWGIVWFILRPGVCGRFAGLAMILWWMRWF